MPRWKFWSTEEIAEAGAAGVLEGPAIKEPALTSEDVPSPEPLPVDLQSCGNCICFIQATCRRYPPALIPTALHANAPRWPAVKAHQWCGEWRAQ
jgi:hypothetical protein